MDREKTKRCRRCIACGLQETKGALRRFVRRADGTVAFYPMGRAPGRGAYVCSEECYQAARKGRKLERALRTKLTDEDYDRLAGEMSRATDDRPSENEE